MPTRRKGIGNIIVNDSGYQSSQEISNETVQHKIYSRAKCYVVTETESQLEIPKHHGWGTRHTLVLFGFLGFLVSYAMRVNLSFAIVAMVYSNSSYTSRNTSIDACPNLLPQRHQIYLKEGIGITMLTDPSLEEEGEFDWNAEDQGIIIGAFFWGYVALQVPGGMLAERIGGKWPFGIGMLITALFSLLTPWAARTGKSALIIVRIIQGLGEGVTNPSMHVLLARWLPPLERSKLGTLIYAGAQIGTVLAMPLCGYLISSGFMGGWPGVFYVMGMLGIIWFVFWTIFVFNTPAVHPRIEARELSYIQHSIGSQTSKHKVPTPWKKILTSMPVLAILVCQIAQGWGGYTLLTELPNYFKTILHFDIRSNGKILAIPYVSMYVFSIVCSCYADFLREANIASTTTVRKMFNTIGQFIPALALIGAAYSGCDRVLTVALLTLAVGVNGATYASYHVNHIDLAPNHAGVLMGITNGIANLAGIAAPYVAGVIIKDGASLDNWRLIFFISAFVYVVGNIFYVTFASGEEQSWNRESNKDSKRDLKAKTDRDPLLSSYSE